MDYYACMYDTCTVGSRFTDQGHRKQEIEKVFPGEKERKEFYTRVGEVIEKVYAVLKRCQQKDLLETCFDFWHKSSFFPLPGL